MSRILATLLAGGAIFGVVQLMGDEPLDCSGGGRLCPQAEAFEENPAARMARIDARADSVNFPAPGALRAAYEGKMALAPAKDAIRGANGQWQEYGRGPLQSSGLAQTLGADLGASVPDVYTHDYAGRVDDFAYDNANKRLFAAVSTGGIWMSEAVNGDITTIGDRWVPIGDNLPTLANGGVIYTAAGGGTLIAATGDNVMSTGAYHGLGAFWSTDLGLTWTRAEGFPDDALVFNTANDLANPNIVYIASSMGLYRSQDAGRTFQNVALPTTEECAGNIDRSGPCNLANVVSDVVVQAPGGATSIECSHNGCPVLAAVGWRAGALPYNSDGVTPQSPNNGLYRSDTGLPGTFEKLNPPPVDPATEQGFAPQERIGRIEMGEAWGPLQDHGYVYVMVQDAELLNGNASVSLDPPLDALGTVPVPTLINGMYVTPDFGDTWYRMADSVELGSIPGPLAALVPPGVQSWYNQFIRPDPTRATPLLGVPTRMVFGLEEVFQNLGSAAQVPLNGIAQAGPQDFQNIGYYFSLSGLDQTTHPDQHGAIFVPTELGGVCLFVGNDGGVSKQCLLPGEEFDNRKWGRGANKGFYTLLPYGLGVAKDGTVWWGLQDNGSGHTDPDTGISYGDFGADGFYAEVDPDNSDIAYTESQNGGLRRTTDRGETATDIAPAYLRVNFANWFSMDPLNGQHMITLANQVFETLEAETVTNTGWKEVYRMGINPRNQVPWTATVGDVHGEAIYIGACGDCGVTNNDQPFENKVATNIGGRQPPKSGTSQGWHTAKAEGLPNRLITAIEIDPNDPFTVYYGLGAYSSGLRGPETFGEDPNDDANVEAGNLFKSTDAGETFYPIQGELPQQPITSIVVRDGQLLVATEFGAFISSDLEGGSWAPLGNDLPNVPVTQLKLQPGNPNRLFASTFGRHIWVYDFPEDSQLEVAERSVGLGSSRGGAMGLGLLVLLAGGLLARRRG